MLPRASRFLFPILVALLLLARAGGAEASILQPLQEIISSVEAGDIDAANVSLTSHAVRVNGKTTSVHGKRERRQVRYARLHLLLDGDQRTAYEAHGWPTYRLREDAMGVITETWTYPEKNLTLVFRGNRLIETRGK